MNIQQQLNRVITFAYDNQQSFLAKFVPELLEDCPCLELDEFFMASGVCYLKVYNPDTGDSSSDCIRTADFLDWYEAESNPSASDNKKYVLHWFKGKETLLEEIMADEKYEEHLVAMTVEGLQRTMDIAVELARRDIQIAKLEQKIADQESDG